MPRNPIMISLVLHAAALLGITQLATLPTKPRPTPVLRIHESNYSPPPAPPPVVIPQVVSEPDEQPPLLEIEIEEPEEALPEPEPEPEPLRHDRERRAEPTLDRVVLKRPKAPPVAPTLPQQQQATDTQEVPTPTSPERAARVPAEPFEDNRPPQYPRSARRAGQQGCVIVRITIDAAGHPERFAVVESSGYRCLDDAAIRALRTWRFEPAMAAGIAVASETEIALEFRLNGPGANDDNPHDELSRHARGRRR